MRTQRHVVDAHMLLGRAKAERFYWRTPTCVKTSRLSTARSVTIVLFLSRRSITHAFFLRVVATWAYAHYSRACNYGIRRTRCRPRRIAHARVKRHRSAVLDGAIRTLLSAMSRLNFFRLLVVKLRVPYIHLYIVIIIISHSDLFYVSFTF